MATATTTTPPAPTFKFALPDVGQFLHVVLPLWPLGLLLLLAGIAKAAFWLREERRLRNAGMSEIDVMDGPTFERRLSVLFRDLGYDTEITGSSVGDYGCDLIVTRDSRRTVVQAKRWSKSVGISAVQEAVGARGYYKADWATVVTNRGFTKPARNLASANGVDLWDREKLVSALLQARTQAAPQALQPVNVCASCGKTVSSRVLQYCENHKEQFGGKVYCFDHQRPAAAAFARSAHPSNLVRTKFESLVRARAPGSSSRRRAV